jgi:dipeptidyl-peptidase-4
MMMKIKHLLIFTFLVFPLAINAQEGKQEDKKAEEIIDMLFDKMQKLFSLEDLNFGGRNYRNLQPENKWYAWWGDELVRIDKEQCFIVDKKTGKDIRPLTDDENSNRKEGAKATTIIKDHQLYVIDAQGKERQLTTDGSRSIVYGSAVHRNEFGINKGTFWSPDSGKLAFYRMDQSMVTDYPQVNIFPRAATYEPDKYPMAGMNAHVVTIGVYDINTDKTIYLKTHVGSVCGDSVATSTPIYFTNIAWSPDGKTIYMFELNRDQNDCRLVSYDATTGERIAELYRETSDKYVEPLHPIQFLPWDNNQFIMQSQRDGYNHLYLYNKEGKLLKQLTSGSWVVQNVLGFNAKQKSIIIEGNKYHPLHRQIYSVNVNNGKMTQLTTEDGIHHGELSASGAFLIDRHSAPNQPRNISVIDICSGKTARATRLFTADDPWKDYEQPIFECGSIKAADGVTDLYYRMVKPHDFNPNKKYPTVVYVYGGPHAHNVEAGWHWASRSWETYMAQKGYIVFILDNRGSEYRGRDFEQATFRQLGQIEMQDQIKGVEYLKSLPYVNADKLGVHGWSFGGFMTISLMLNYPDVFKVGVAGGPVIDWKWYEVMYGERYMDTPQQNPEGYEKTSLINKAGNLKGKLQIITGYNDNTVVPQHCLSFLDACIKAGTQPDFFAYPGEEHNMRGHASVHLHERITQYFEDYLK